MYIATKYRFIATIFLTMTIGAGIPGQLLADSAAVLPANVSRGYLDYYHYRPTTQRYNAEGDLEDLAFPFTNATLDSNVLAVLSDLDPFVTGFASIGDVAIAYQYDIDILDIGYNYGLTDRLSLGFHIPYYWITNNVDTSFSSVNANVGLHPTTRVCCVPIASGGEYMTTDDVQNLIKSEYGFDAVETWQSDGVGDIEMGAKYQLYQKQNSAFSVTGGLRIPSGYEDDADKLTDVAWSYGNYAALLRLNYDYQVSNLWHEKPIKLYQGLPLAGDVIINLTFRFDYMLPDSKVMRVGDTPDQVFTNKIERVSRKLGDLYNIKYPGNTRPLTRFHSAPPTPTAGSQRMISPVPWDLTTPAWKQTPTPASKLLFLLSITLLWLPTETSKALFRWNSLLPTVIVSKVMAHARRKPTRYCIRVG